MRSSPDFGKLSLTQLHGKLLTFEQEIDQKRKLIKSGKSTDEYVQGNTTLLSHNSETNDQGYDEYIDITTGITSSSSSCDDHSPISDYLCFIMDDLHKVPSDDLEEMDIVHQLALLSIRTNKFYKRTGRKFLGINGKTRIGLNKAKMNCLKPKSAVKSGLNPTKNSKCFLVSKFIVRLSSESGTITLVLQRTTPRLTIK
ncbi:hypothetical protein R6Q57_024644 [Mikania cordata]